MIPGRPLAGVHGQQAGAVAEDISTTNLLGFWRLNEGTGTAAVSETGTHQGTLVGSPTWVTGKSGTGVSFNGTSQYINVTYATTLNLTGNVITLMAWINATTTAAARRILNLPYNEGSGNEKYSLMLSGGTLQMWLFTGSETNASTTFTTTGSWAHVAGVYNGTDMRLYINGSLSGTPVSKTGNIQTRQTGDFQIGRFGPTWGQYFSGIIDDARIYGRACSAAEILQVYNLG